MDKVAMFIPAHNEEKYLGLVLEDGLRFKREGIIDHFFVVDSRSTDATAEIARGMGVEIIPQAIGWGKGGAFLEGVRHCIGKGATIILTFDADIIKHLKREQVESMILEIQENPSADMVIFPPIEGGRGDKAALLESLEYSGQRAFRASELAFLFSKKKGEDGLLLPSDSRPAKIFRAIAWGYGLEEGLNHWFDRESGIRCLQLDKDKVGLIELAPKARRRELFEQQYDEIERIGKTIASLADQKHLEFIQEMNQQALARKTALEQPKSALHPKPNQSQGKLLTRP
ncbi:MAG: glycosyltransferase [Candidatus Micrarchaeota archaeon]|nr:glycosyltransferase [Candidatus Micrarchaeota archaeon]